MISREEIQKKQLYICIGKSGSGKTTFRRTDCVVVCKDDIRLSMLNFPKTKRDFYIDAPTGSIGKHNLEEIVTEATKCVFRQLCSKSYNIYLDETNLTPNKRSWYYETAFSYDYDVHFIVFKNPKAEENNKRRERRVPDEILKLQDKIFTPLTSSEKYFAKTVTTIDKNIKVEGD